MKKYLIFLLAAAVALVSCEQEILDPGNRNETVQAALITFNLSATHPDATKAVKSEWESGDAIFVFFNNVAAPKYLKMTFNGGTSWTSVEYDGDTATPGALGLKNNDTGTMRAIFLPFGSDATVSADGSSFKFSTTYYAYYATATLSYEVTDNKVSGAFNMVIPDNYVQFFVEDAAATNGGYTLGTDAVIPVGVASITADGTITETNKSVGNDLTGFVYSGGYLFSGKLNGSYNSQRYVGGTLFQKDAYYFAKTKADGTERHDYFAIGKTLESHSAIKLPANGDSRWQAVGKDKYVQLQYEGSDTNLWWSTCNYDQSLPESPGSLYKFADANSIQGVALPSKDQFQSIAAHCGWISLSVHGTNGRVVKADNGFLFLPLHKDTYYYWSSTEDTDYNYAWSLELSGPSIHTMSRKARINTFLVRPATLLIDLSSSPDNAVTIPAGTCAVITGSKSDCVVTVAGGGSIVTLKDASMHCLIIQGSATIEVKGENTLTTNSTSNIQAKGPVTFRGDGSLTTNSLTSVGSEYADITFESGTYSFTRSGITAKSLDVKGGIITAQGLSGVSATAIRGSGSVQISGGEINATGDLIGLYVSDGDLTISGGTVNATQTCNYCSSSKYAHAGIAVNGGTLTISGGTVVATGNYGSGIGGWTNGWAENLPATATGILISGGDVTASSIGASAIGYAGAYYKSGPYCGEGGITITKDITRLKLESTNLPSEMFRTNNTDNTCIITIDGVESPTAESTFEHLNLAVSTTTNENDTWTLTPKE